MSASTALALEGEAGKAVQQPDTQQSETQPEQQPQQPEAQEPVITPPADPAPDVQPPPAVPAPTEPSPAGSAPAEPSPAAASDPGRDSITPEPPSDGTRHPSLAEGTSGREDDAQQSPPQAGMVQAPLGLPGLSALAPVPVSTLAIGNGGGTLAGTGATKLPLVAGAGCQVACRSWARLSVAAIALPRGARPADRREVEERAAGLAAEATATRLPGIPGSGQGLFSLLAGGGGGAVTVVFVGFLAVLTAALAWAPDWSRSLRLPDGLWSPSAFTTPIELPG